MSILAPRFQAHCARCGCTVRVPDTLPLEAFQQAVALRRSGNTIHAIAALVAAGAMDRGEAKSLVFHMTTTPGRCHRCRKSLVAGSELCLTCRCVNLDAVERQRNG